MTALYILGYITGSIVTLAISVALTVIEEGKINWRHDDTAIWFGLVSTFWPLTLALYGVWYLVIQPVALFVRRIEHWTGRFCNWLVRRRLAKMMAENPDTHFVVDPLPKRGEGLYSRIRPEENWERKERIAKEDRERRQLLEMIGSNDAKLPPPSAYAAFGEEQVRLLLSQKPS